MSGMWQECGRNMSGMRRNPPGILVIPGIPGGITGNPGINQESTRNMWGSVMYCTTICISWDYYNFFLENLSVKLDSTYPKMTVMILTFSLSYPRLFYLIPGLSLSYPAYLGLLYLYLYLSSSYLVLSLIFYLYLIS